MSNQHLHIFSDYNPLECFFGIEGHVALDRNLGLVYNTLLLQSSPRDL